MTSLPTDDAVPVAEPTTSETATTVHRRRWIPAAVGLGLVGALVAVAVVVTTRNPPQAAAEAGTSPTAAASTDSAASTAPASIPEITAILRAREAALLRGDRAGWLAHLGPGAERAVRDQLTAAYDNLRALGVTEVHLRAKVINAAGDDATIAHTLAACFTRPPCPTRARPLSGRANKYEMTAVDTIQSTQTWRRGATGSYQLTYETPPSRYDPPWHSAKRPRLTAVVGDRVTIVGPKSLREGLAKWLPIAREAVAHAEPFQTRGDRVERYFVYIADRAAWKTWFGGETSRWAAGYYPGMLTTSTRTVVISDTTVRSPKDRREVLRHELGHAATLDVRARSNSADWWLAEGMAQYIAFSDQSAGSYFWPELRSWISKRKPTAIGTTGGPADDANDDDVHGLYGLAYSSVSCLVAKFGVKKVREFFDASVLDGLAFDVASTKFLRSPWSKVSRDCATYIRDLVR